MSDSHSAFVCVSAVQSRADGDGVLAVAGVVRRKKMKGVPLLAVKYGCCSNRGDFPEHGRCLTTMGRQDMSLAGCIESQTAAGHGRRTVEPFAQWVAYLSSKLRMFSYQDILYVYWWVAGSNVRCNRDCFGTSRINRRHGGKMRFVFRNTRPAYLISP